jgi:hypothetical protein
MVLVFHFSTDPTKRPAVRLFGNYRHKRGYEAVIMEAFFHQADTFVIEFTAFVLLVVTAYQLIKHKLKP